MLLPAAVRSVYVREDGAVGGSEVEGEPLVRLVEGRSGTCLRD